MKRVPICCRCFFRALILLAAGLVPHLALTQTAVNTPLALEQKEVRTVSDWLMRMHDASRSQSYSGVVVVSSGSVMASSKIIHACDGAQQIERVESLSGTPRTTYRKNDQVVTFSPQSRVAVKEQREALGVFPDLLKSADTRIDQFYTVVREGSSRVAGFEADQLLIEPKDKLRFAYRLWSEKESGLVVKMQTLDGQGKTLEQVSFSELQLVAALNMRQLSQMMADMTGYKVETLERVKTTAQAQGWQLKQMVAGFQSMNCYLPPEGRGRIVQWIFSDGLASVSLFIESVDAHRVYGVPGLMVMGATHTLTHRLKDKTGEWWITVMGEVPPQTLQAFARGVERRP